MILEIVPNINPIDRAEEGAAKKLADTTRAIEDRDKENSTNILAKLAALLNDVAKEENFLSQFQEHHQEALQYSIHSGMRQLEAQANCVNAIATQLEAEILRFTEIAEQVNQTYHQWQQQKDCLNREDNSQNYRYRFVNIWEVHYSKVPQLFKSGLRYILTDKIIDLFGRNRAK